MGDKCPEYQGINRVGCSQKTEYSWGALEGEGPKQQRTKKSPAGTSRQVEGKFT